MNWLNFIKSKYIIFIIVLIISTSIIYNTELYKNITAILELDYSYLYTKEFEFILSKLILFSFWFSLGVYLNCKLLPSTLKASLQNFVSTKNAIQLFILLFSIIFPIKLILGIISDYMLIEFLENIFLNKTGLQNMVESQTGDNIINENNKTKLNETEQTAATQADLTSPAAGESITCSSAELAQSDNNSNSSTINSSITQTKTESQIKPQTQIQLDMLGQNISRAADAGIMAAALSGAFKLAQKMPSTAGKLAAISAGIGAGAASIGIKNATSNLTSKIEPKKILPGLPELESLNDLFTNLFNLTGNSVIDLLLYIQYFQKIQLFVVIIISYHLVFFFINENKLENYLLNSFPSFSKFILFYVKSIKILKKSIILSLVVLILILLYCNFYSIYYIQFFIDNLDDIIEYYIKNK